MDRPEVQSSDLRTSLAAALEQRDAAGRALAEEAETIARACRDMALGFHRGGKLIAFGNGASSTDAQHLAVEFVHPVIVGKRALPAISLTSDAGTVTGLAGREGWDEVFAYQLRYLARPQDIAVAVSQSGFSANLARGLEVAKSMGLLTVALVGGAAANGSAVHADHILAVRSDDPQIAKELQVTIYHILWELVHVFFEQPGALEMEAAR